MNKRTSTIVIALLTVVVGVCGVLNLRLHQRLHRAEQFAQSGLASWKNVCIAVAAALDHDIAIPVDIASSCVAKEDTQAAIISYVRNTAQSVAPLIRDAYYANRLPIVVKERDVEVNEFPQGYER